RGAGQQLEVVLSEEERPDRDDDEDERGVAQALAQVVEVLHERHARVLDRLVVGLVRLGGRFSRRRGHQLFFAPGSGGGTPGRGGGSGGGAPLFTGFRSSSER